MAINGYPTHRAVCDVSVRAPLTPLIVGRIVSRRNLRCQTRRAFSVSLLPVFLYWVGGPPSRRRRRELRGCPTLSRSVRKGGCVHRHRQRGIDGARLPLMPRGLKRHYGSHDLHFITRSCYRRRPLLNMGRRRDLLLKLLEEVRQRHRFVVLGYVIMPKHFHLLISEPQEVHTLGRDAGPVRINDCTVLEMKI
jgi:hypothetical protein